MKGGNAAVNESLLIPKNGTLPELCPGSNEGFIGGGAGAYTRTYREGSSWRIFCAGEGIKILCTGNGLFLGEAVRVGRYSALNFDAVFLGHVLGFAAEQNYSVENIEGFSYARLVKNIWSKILLRRRA
jgi:hypothetical protein